MNEGWKVGGDALVDEGRVGDGERADRILKGVVGRGLNYRRTDALEA